MDEQSNFTAKWLLSTDVWTGLAHYYVSLPLYPLFQTVHFILTAMALRRENGGLLHMQYAYTMIRNVW